MTKSSKAADFLQNMAEDVAPIAPPVVRDKAASVETSPPFIVVRFLIAPPVSRLVIGKVGYYAPVCCGCSAIPRH